jgi:type I restriction enzyme M protein
LNPQNTLRKQDIARVVKTYKTRKTIDKYSYLATYEEVKEKGYSLNIPRYVDLHVSESEVDIKKIQKEIDQLEDQLISVQKELRAYLKELGYGA